MSIRFHRYGVWLAFLILGATIGCERERTAIAGPTALASSMTTSSSFSFEPATLRAELEPSTSCVTFRPFGTRIIVVVNASGTVILSGLRFRFTDRFGLNALPIVTALSGSSPLAVTTPTVPPFNPISIPGVAPLPPTAIPIPGASSVTGLMVPAGNSRHLPFFLRFDCGVASEGTLFVTTDVAGPSGTLHTSEFRLRVGS